MDEDARDRDGKATDPDEPDWENILCPVCGQSGLLPEGEGEVMMFIFPGKYGFRCGSCGATGHAGRAGIGSSRTDVEFCCVSA